jgi:hypothetical protein
MKYLFLIALLQIGAGVSHAQAVDSSESTGLDLHLDFIATNAAFVSLPLSDQLALRIGTDLSWTQPDEDNSGTRIYNGGSGSTVNQDKYALRRISEQTYFSLTASSILFGEVFEIRRLSVHCGIGPFITYASESFKYDDYQRGQTDTTSSWGESSSKSWSIGAMSVVSARVQLTGEISLHADYTLSVSRTTVDATSRYSNVYPSISYSYDTTERRSTTRWMFDGFTAGIIVAL